MDILAPFRFPGGDGDERGTTKGVKPVPEVLKEARTVCGRSSFAIAIANRCSSVQSVTDFAPFCTPSPASTVAGGRFL